MTDLNAYAYNELNISDLHKEARGFRCHNDFNNGQWTKESIDSHYDNLLVELKESIENEKIWREEAVVKFEAHLTKLMADFGISRSDAIRWDMQAEEIEFYNSQDVEGYLVFKGILGHAKWQSYLDEALIASGLKKAA